MKFVEQNVELIERNKDVVKFKVNTSFSVYKELKDNENFNVDICLNEYITRSNKENIKFFDLESEKGVVDAYNYGINFCDILRESKTYTRTKLVNTLKKNNVELKYHDTPNIDIIHDYFDSIDSPEKAYFIGLLQTDGCLRYNYFEIIQKCEYCWPIINLYKNICYDVLVYNHTSCYRMRLSDKHISERLIEIGIIKNKTYNQTDEMIDRLFSIIPDEYMSDFIRGLIDGDGSVSFYIQSRGVNESGEIMFCARSKHIIDVVSDIIYKVSGYMPKKCVNRGVNVLRIRDTKTVIELGKYLFRNFKYPFGHPKKAVPYLKRIGGHFEISEYGDPKFLVTFPYYIDKNDVDSIYLFCEQISKEEYDYRNDVLKNKMQPFDAMKDHMSVECIIESDVSNINNIDVSDNNQLNDVINDMKSLL